MRKNHNLTSGSIFRHMLSLTWPGIGGSLAITIFNLTDTFFVSRLGTDSLAAMGFTFPVVMIIGATASGISMGSGSVLSRAMGSGNTHMMKRTATDGILLSVFLVGIISLAGVFSLDILFKSMGASGNVLSLVKDYMFIWYLGSMAVVMPPVSDSCLRATGDMIRPFIVMMVCAGMNVILDPILIFGYFGFPAMGIKGASLATVISRCFGMIVTLSFLHFHAGLVDFSIPDIREIKESWVRILKVGIPSAFIQLLLPLTRGFVTRLAALAGGSAAVAAVASGSRIESFALIFAMAYNMAIVPMVGQNWGAEKFERIESIRKFTLKLSIVYGLFVFMAAFIFSRSLSGIFSNDLSVISYTVLYLRIITITTGAFCLYTWTGQSLIAAGLPRPAAILNITGMLLIQIPLAFFGSRIFGFTGLIAGIAAGQGITAVIAWFISRKYLSRIID
jgi:MATE family, multidrug efflux pump